MRIISAALIAAFISYPLFALETGKPSGIDPAVDYYKIGRNAAKSGDFSTAAKMLRFAYFSRNDANTFFWYCDALNRGGFADELIAEYEAAPEAVRYGKDYGAHPARMTAETLRRSGNTSKAADILVEAYRKNTKDRNAVGSMLVFQNMLDTGLSTAFMKHPDYSPVIDAMCTSIQGGSSSGADIADAKNLYFFLVLAAAERAKAGDKTQAEKLIGKAGGIVSKFGAMDTICNQANFEVMKNAVLWYSNRKTEARTFRWLCLYTNAVEAQDETGRKIHAAHSDAFVRTKLEEIRFNLAAASVFYSYISGGRIDMEFDIRRHDAVSSAVTAGKPKKADIRSLEPFPLQLMREYSGRIDGLMFFYPAFDPVSYLGGIGSYPVVPYVLDSKPVFMLNMISGAAANVFIHEIFHGFESRYKIGEAHLYAKENSAKWPSWYRTVTAKNGGESAEWVYYQRVFDEKMNTQKDQIFPSQDGAPYAAATLEKAESVLLKYGASRCREISAKLSLTDELAKKDKAAAEKEYSKLAAEFPDHPDLLFRRGYFYHWTAKNRGKAQGFYDRYLELYPGFPSTFTAALYSCTWYANRGDHARVLSITDSALPYMRSPYDVWHLTLPRAKALALSGKKEEARTILSRGAADSENPLREEYKKELVKLPAK